jgi:single-stranded-DNA-specific exonuclease
MVIVTDHHAPELNADGSYVLPPALAVVHTTQLCGATVAWMLSHQVVRTLPSNKAQRVVVDAVDICAIATIADQVSLTKANRAFAFHGVLALRQTERPGILALLKLSAVQQAEIDTYTINFVLAPRINAMGRLAHGLDALRLLCTTSVTKARELAQTLHQTNSDRQELTADLVELALAQARQRLEASPIELKVIVVASDQFHEGVVGLVAGKLVEVFSRPAIAISLNEVMGKASARSVPGVNIIELIRQVKDDLLEAGGHPMAAGFGLELAKLERVQQRLEELAFEQIGTDQLVPVLEIDCPLPYALATKKTAQALETFAPFGKGNPEPLFLLTNYLLADIQLIGKDGRHLNLS